MTKKSLDFLKLELKRVNRRKANLENEILELEWQQTKEKLDLLGLSFDKIYRVDMRWITWYNENHQAFGNEGFLSNFEYRIEMIDENGVYLSQITDDELGGFHIYSPVDLLIEVNEHE